MTSLPRPRFSVRLQLAEDVDLAPYDGVPAHLLTPLREWVGKPLVGLGGLDYMQNISRDLCLKLRIAVPSRPGSNNFGRLLADQQGLVLLDVVDELLGYVDADGEPFADDDSVDTLARILDAGGSAYRVNQDRDGLEERITPGVRESVRATIAEAATQSTAGSAAEHLAAAWQAAYGLHPDPVRSYSESIKAVESAAHAAIQPNHSKATLGTILGELANVRRKIITAFPAGLKSDPVGMVEAMMRTLWEGQTARHGGQGGTPNESLESARAAVHLAATLVQWFVSGAVTRIP